MIGRYAGQGAVADVGAKKLAQVGTAGALIVGAVVAQYAADAAPWVVITLCVSSLALTGFPIVWEALCGLVRLRTNVDELVSLAIVASLVLGEWVTAAVVAFIMVLGSLIEELTSDRARRHLDALTEASPRHAFLLGDDGEAHEVAVDALRPGQRILVRPGDVVPADGTVEEGASEADESMLTGESVPVAKGPGDAVSSGTLNLDGSLAVRIARVGEDSTHGRIRRLISEAEQHRAPILREAERYARWFTPAILVLAALVWIFTGDVHRAVTMLIVGCPCAFVLATPTAVVAALGRASKSGILVKGGKYLEACAHVQRLAFDKTGTLTTGRFVVQEVVAVDGLAADEVLAHAARLEASSEHPLARAIVDEARRRGVPFTAAPSIRREPGLGVTETSGSTESGQTHHDSPRTVRFDGISPANRGGFVLTPYCRWRVGNERLMHEAGISADTCAAARGGQFDGTAVYVAQGAELRGIVFLQDELRPDGAEVLARLAAAGFPAPLLLTGDSPAVADRVAARLGLPAANVAAGLLPEDKVARIQGLEDEGVRICFVGDGTNDGPALTAASVGVSIGARNDTVAMETADAVLMRDGLEGLPLLLQLGRATTRTIHQNLLLFGLLFNASMLAVSAAGLLTPILGAVGHNLGSVAVVLNSARLLRYRP